MPTHERSFKVETIVLRHSDWGEADRLLNLFTLEMGKVRAIAKGVRKLRSRKAGHLEPFTRASLLLARGRDMLLITQAETLDAYIPLRDNLLLSSHAAYVVELLDRFTFEEGENRPLYRLLADTLARFCTPVNPDLVTRYYEVHFLDLVGFRPQLFHCVQCNREIQPQDQYFSAEQGGALCPSCGQNVPGSRPVSLNALRYMRHFQRSSYTQVAQAPLAVSVNNELELLMQHYLTYLLERGLNKPAFLRRARKSSQENQIPQQEIN
jgi:DNA repair protein RecO (recombination protein O)